MSIKYFAFAFAIVGIFVAALVVASGDPATGRAQEAEASSPMPQLYWVDGSRQTTIYWNVEIC